MSGTTQTTNAGEQSLDRIAMDLLHSPSNGRRGLIVLTVAALGAGAYFNWDWLVAVQIAPLLLALAPCIAMCALGLCMNKAGAKFSSTVEAGRSGRRGKSVVYVHGKASDGA